LAKRAVSLLHQGEGRTSEDLEGDKPLPAPDQDLESDWNFLGVRLAVVSLCAKSVAIVYAI